MKEGHGRMNLGNSLRSHFPVSLGCCLVCSSDLPLPSRTYKGKRGTLSRG